VNQVKDEEEQSHENVVISNFSFPTTDTISPFMDLPPQGFSNELLKEYNAKHNLANELKMEPTDPDHYNNVDSLANELSMALSSDPQMKGDGDHHDVTAFLQGDDQAYFTQLQFHHTPTTNDHDSTVEYQEQSQEPDAKENKEIHSSIPPPLPDSNDQVNSPIENKNEIKNEKKTNKESHTTNTLEVVVVDQDNNVTLEEDEQHDEPILNASPSKAQASMVVQLSLGSNSNVVLEESPLATTTTTTTSTAMTKRHQLMLDHLKTQLVQSREACYHFSIFLLLAYQYYPLSQGRHAVYWLKLNEALTPWKQELEGWYEHMEGQLHQNNGKK